MVKKGQSSQDDILETLGDFTSKENWDKFFTIRGSGDSFEWYAEWSQLRQPLFSLLLGSKDATPSSSSSSLQILIPGCGNSRLSEHLYDAGFHGITNIDFSKVVISDMLRRNLRDRPVMRWRVMDMTSMQFADEIFDTVLDKGGLDALMEPEAGLKLGNQYLLEVKRVLKNGGKFICLTLAEPHVLGLLFSKFRFGWKVNVDSIPRKLSSRPALQTFMVIAEKEESTILHQVSLLFDSSSLDCNKNQAAGLCEALENENQIRKEYISGSDIVYSLEDLQLGVKGDLMNLSGGRRVGLTLVSSESCFSYKAVLLDAPKQSAQFSYHCGVFIVPKTRAQEWLFSSEEGQWVVVESSKAARLIMVLLDSSHTGASMEDIQKDLSPMVKQLAPENNDDTAQIPFMMGSDGIKQRNIVHQVTSSLTGPVIVEDVMYESVAEDVSQIVGTEDLKFRRLVFLRTEGLIQSEALLIKDEPSHKHVGEVEKKKVKASMKTKQKGIQKVNDERSDHLRVYHGFLASSYHIGIIAGFTLISSFLESFASTGRMIKSVVIGLGAGLLPMFLHECMPSMQIEAVELDPLMVNLSKDYFGFIQDERLKVNIAEGVQFIRDVTNSNAVRETSAALGKKDAPSSLDVAISNENSTIPQASFDILIVDVDSSDSSSGMSCPAADFVEEAFLLSVKDALPDHGLFVVNLVSRSPAIKNMVVSRMKAVFSQLFCLQLEEDVNMVLFGLCSNLSIDGDCFPESASQLQKLLKCKHPEISQSVIETAKKLKCWK